MVIKEKHMKRFKLFKKSPLAISILVVFCCVSTVLGVLFALGNFFAKVEHEKKWSEYDECGIF